MVVYKTEMEYIKMRNFYAHLSVALEVERNTYFELWRAEWPRGT